MTNANGVQFKKKIFLLGDEAVGKTSLIRRFVVNEFSDSYISTIGTKVSKKEVTIAHPDHDGAAISVTLMIWDVMGQRTFETVVSRYFEGGEGALLVFDLTRRNTLRSVARWRHHLFARAGEVPVLLLGNKADLTDEFRISRDTVDRATERMDTSFLLTSAKTGLNVDKAFHTLATRMAREELAAMAKE